MEAIVQVVHHLYLVVLVAPQRMHGHLVVSEVEEVRGEMEEEEEEQEDIQVVVAPLTPAVRAVVVGPMVLPP